MKTFERRFAIDTQDDFLQGIVLRYGDISDQGFHYEIFAPEAFGDSIHSESIILNRQHQRTIPLARNGSGLSFKDSAEMLTMRAQIPDTTDGQDVMKLVRAKVLTGLSVEFYALSENVTKDGEKPLVEVRQAKLVGVSVCDTPAYSDSVIEARAAHVRTLANEARAAPRVRRIFI